MKTIRQMALIGLIAALLALPGASLAELRRGDRGENVKGLQEMLIDLGFLEDQADGIFGGKTEAAVKALQRYWGQETDGVADDELVNGLTFLWQTALDIATENNLPEEEMRRMYPASCGWYEDEMGYTQTEHCFRHARQARAYAWLAGGKAPEKLERMLAQRVSDCWLADIKALYDEWDERLAENDRHIILEQRQLFWEALTERRQAWAIEYGPDSVGALLEEVHWLNDTGVGLCFDLHGAEGNGI